MNSLKQDELQVDGKPVENASSGRARRYICTHARTDRQPENIVPHPVFENTYFSFFFQISKNMTFYVFFEMTYQKVVKSNQQKFSHPQQKT